jgi:hypothetical protein
MLEKLENTRQPLLLGSDIVAYINFVQRGRGKRFTGDFVPGPAFDMVRGLFESAVAACQAIDYASPENYEERWHVWSQVLKKIDALELQFGNPPVPIEAFEIDYIWAVAFDVALWWLVEKDLEAEKVLQNSQFRNIETRFS